MGSHMEEVLKFARRSVLAAAVAGAVAAAAPVQAQEPLSVVATTGMVADAARAVGGDLVEVRALMGPGVDPHAYRQTRTDILALTQADLVLWNGLYLEAQLEEFLLDLGSARRSWPWPRRCPRNCASGMTTMPTVSTRTSGWTRISGPTSWARSPTRSS
jgi:manganese/zinc/iron transport system substrate-binding protein